MEAKEKFTLEELRVVEFWKEGGSKGVPVSRTVIVITESKNAFVHFGSNLTGKGCWVFSNHVHVHCVNKKETVREIIDLFNQCALTLVYLKSASFIKK